MSDSNTLRKILITTDGSQCATSAVDLLLRFPLNGTEALILTVIEQTDQQIKAGETPPDSVAQQAQATIDELAERLTLAEYKVASVIRRGHAADQILKEAEDFGADLIVVGTRGHGLIKRFLLGSVSQKVVEYARCPVLLGRPGRQDTPIHPISIVMGYDGSSPSKKGLETLEQLSLNQGDQIHLVTVMTLLPHYGMEVVQQSSPQWQAEKAASQKALQEAQTRLSKSCANVSSQLIQGTDISEEICKSATDRQTDLIVVGATGVSRISRFLLGSVSNKVMRYAPCSVWVVR